MIPDQPPSADAVNEHVLVWERELTPDEKRVWTLLSETEEQRNKRIKDEAREQAFYARDPYTSQPSKNGVYTVSGHGLSVSISWEK